MSAPATPVAGGDADARAYPAYPLVAVSIAVFRQGQVLLARRAAPPAAGLWSLPGGLVEPGETLHDAALRELAEETGVRARDAVFAANHEVIMRDDAGAVSRHYVIAVFAAAWAGDGAATEPSHAGWFGENDIAGLETTPGLAAIVARAGAALADARSGGEA